MLLPTPKHNADDPRDEEAHSEPGQVVDHVCSLARSSQSDDGLGQLDQ